MKTTLGALTAALPPLILIATLSLAQQTPPAAGSSNNDSAAQTDPHSPAPPANSKVRIVRLSQVKGSVKLDRNTGRGFESAMPNLPITEGARLQTETGLAEVEFEDNSTLRLAPETLAEFPQLELLPTGATSSAVTMIRGTVYASLASTKNNRFTLAFGSNKLILTPSSHVRLEMTPGQAKLSVLEGNIQVEQPSGTITAGKKKTLTFDLASQSQPAVTGTVARDQYDSWDKNAADYHKSYAGASAYGNSPYSYGISDMNYYGSFLSAAGCGSMWRPYLVSAAWDPFANGVWAWYPNIGYSWVSPYPWGWMPYHYGSWNYCQGVGWGWQPGGLWMGLANTPTVLTHRSGLLLPTPPQRPPASGGSSLLAVNLRPITSSAMTSADTLVLRNDSAGLGIPRGSFGKLNKISGEVQQHGSVSMPVYASSAATGAGLEATAPSGQNNPVSQRSANPEGWETRSSSGDGISGAAAHTSAGDGSKTH